MGEPAPRLLNPMSEVMTPAPAAPAEATPPPPVGPAPVLDTTQKAGTIDLATALRLIAERHGQSYQQSVLEIAKLNFGAGRVNVGEYIDLGLFDRRYTFDDKRAFVGLTAARRIWVTVNFQREWWGLLDNKLAATSLLGAYGFPTIPTLGVYSETFRLPALPRLQCREELVAFLRDATRYPMFGKPIDSYRSLGSASFERYVADTDSLEKTTGGAVTVDAFADEVLASYRAGYMFQGRVRPHADIRAVCGERLATARIVTIMSGGVVKLARALWKIPAGTNVADNFWRRGNLIAGLDLETGRVLRVQRGTGLAAQEIETHPDTGANLVGMTVPLYRDLVDTALEGHKLFPDFGILGWDMAATDDGALIVEPNTTPDFVLPQLADRRGILDAAFQAFLDERHQAKKSMLDAQQKVNVADARSQRDRVLIGLKA